MSGKIPGGHDTDGVDEGEGPMSEHEQDEAYRRLAAADPAATVAVDVDRLLAAARVRAGLVPPASAKVVAGAAAGVVTPEPESLVAGAGAGAGAEPGGASLGAPPLAGPSDPSGPSVVSDPSVVSGRSVPSGQDELAARRRRRTRGWQVAAAVAALALVGAGGYGLGSSRPSSAGSAASAGGQVAGSADTALAPLVEKAGSGEAVGPRRYVAEGLSATAATGTVFGLGAVTASGALVGRQAQAWGVAGDPVAQGGGSWTVQDGDGDWLSVAVDGSLLRVDLVVAAPRGCPGADCGTPDGARDLALATLGAAGVDTSRLVVQVTGAPGAYTVSALQPAGADLSPLGWTVQVGADGVTSISGRTGDLVELGTYDLVSPAQAALRLNDTRFDGWAQVAAPAAEGPVGVGPAATTDPGPPADGPSPAVVEPGTAVPGAPAVGAPVPAASPGAAVPWPVTTIRLVQARLTLALTSGGHQVLVPAYELTDDTGATYVVPALTDAALEVVDR